MHVSGVDFLCGYHPGQCTVSSQFGGFMDYQETLHMVNNTSQKLHALQTIT